MSSEFRSLKFEILCKTINYQFKSKNVLEKSMTHKSYCCRNNSLESNERLEFLGDTVLGLIITTALMKRHTGLSEGEMSKIRAALVNERVLAETATKIGLGQFLLLGRGENNSGGRKKPSILANALEALIGAIYQDSDLETVTPIVLYLYRSRLDVDPAQYLKEDFKTNLQEMTQKHFNEAPVYQVTSVSGPDHDRTFVINIILQGKTVCSGRGKSKKEAAQAAAEQAITIISEQYPSKRTNAIQQGSKL